MNLGKVKKVLLYCWVAFVLLMTAGLVAVWLRTDPNSILSAEFSATELKGPFGTKYPILIHHGVFPITSLDKFARHLRGNGFMAYSSQVSAAQAISGRAGALAAQIDLLLSKTGASKVNLIAHSMGGLDARYVISSMGYSEKIASLSTISTPHHGASLAAAAQHYSNLVTNSAMNAFSVLIIPGSTWLNIDTGAAVAELTPAFVDGIFNLKNRDSPKVYYQSWAAISGPGTDNTIAWVLYPYWRLIYKAAGPNDGVVEASSAHWGHFRGTIQADHLVQVGNRLFNYSSTFDPLQFYTNLALELGAMGF